MPLLKFSDVAAEYGADVIFEGVDFALEPRQRLGVVGPNGAGKSTLLKLALGQLEPSRGSVERQRRLRLGVLEQFDAALTAESVLEQAILARTDLLDMRHRMHALEQRLAAGEHGDALMHEYGDLQSSYDHGGGYTLEARAREVLGGLGFHNEALEQHPMELSGGQRRRVQLAQLLMLEADVFLLDEPTNHLDLRSIEWLEDYLRAAPQAMLLVSHDRRFLDNVASSILELEAGQAYVYPGNYTKFLRLRAERRTQQLKDFEAQQEYIRHQEAFIQRYKAGQRAREARGRQTRLERLDRVERPPDDKEIRIRFGGPPSAGVPLRSQGIVAGYPGVPLARTGSFAIEAGARVAIVGPNGSGKTTLLRTLQGGLPPLEGGIAYGARVQASYYDQHLGDLPEGRTLVEVLSDAHPIPEESARHHLARLLFRGDDVHKKVRQLSGGERSRLSLARLMLDQGNLLFLDEPTNHLDVPSQEVLQEALLEFAGTLVFVSHDRELIDAVATHTWFVEPPAEGGPAQVRMTIGGYTENHGRDTGTTAPGHWKAPTEVAGRPSPAPVAAGVATLPRRDGAQARAQGAEERRRKAQAQKRVRDLEKAVAEAEAELRGVEARLADPDLYRFPMEAELLGKSHARVSGRLEELMREWEEASA